MTHNPLSSYLRKRTQSMGWSMVVMGGSFSLYYLGLFGNVQGPLTPETIGDCLAGRGVTQTHVLVFFILFALASLTWNHIFNLVWTMTGSRLFCQGKTHDGALCGAPTQKTITPKKKKGVWYTCTQGHTCCGANFHPLKKGVVSHTLWIASLVFIAILLSLNFFA